MEVANAVASIIQALGNGKDVFRRMLGRKSKKKGRKSTMSEEEAWLRQSLISQPEEIRTSFSSNVARHGRRFEVGDDAAHSSLAHILLILNSGLMSLIDALLHREAKYDKSSSSRLRHLSDNATRDTLGVLSQLSLRLSAQPSLRAPDKHDRQRKHRKKGSDAPKSRPDPAPKRIPVVRGAWIRPVKSSRSESTVGLDKPPPKPDNMHHMKANPSYPNLDDGRLAAQPVTEQRRHHRNPVYVQGPGVPVMSSTLLLTQSPERPDYDLPADVRRRRHHSRERPISAATFMTASTKIGEIMPLRTSPGANGYHHSIPESQYIHQEHPAELQPRKLKRGFRFWKREDRPQTIPAN